MPGPVTGPGFFFIFVGIFQQLFFHMKFPLAIVALFGFFKAFAQQDVLLDDNFPATLHYSYLNVQGVSAGPLRDLMREFDPQDPKRVEFDLRYSVRSRVLAGAGRRIEATVEFSQFEAAGLPRPKGFDFSSPFVPEGTTVVLELLRNGQSVQSRTFPNQPIAENGAVQPFRLEFTDTVATRNYTVRIVSAEMLYGNNNVGRLRRKMESLRLYETAVLDIQRMSAELQTIPLDNPRPDDLPTLAGRLAELDRAYTGMGNAPFWEELRLRAPRAYDPGNLNLLGGRFGDELRVRQARLTALQSTVHELYYSEALRFYERKDFASARRSVDKSLAANNRYGPSQYLSASIFFEEKQYARSEQTLADMLGDPNTGGELRRQAFSLADALLGVRLSDAERLKGEKKYREAEEACNSARSFARRLTGYPFDVAGIDRAQASIREADFGDRLAVAQQAFRDRQFDRALSDIESLKAQQQEFRIRPDVDLEQFRRSVLQEKLRITVAKTESDLKAGRLADARRGLAEAESFVRANQGALNGDADLAALRTSVLTAQAAQYAQELADKAKQARKFFDDKRPEQSLQACNDALARLDLIQADFADSWRFAPEFAQTPENIRAQFSQTKFQSLYAIGARELKAKNLPSALSNAREALAFAQASRLTAEVSSAEKLVEDIQLENYLRLVAEGEAAETQNRHQEALVSFRQAAALDGEYGFSAKGRAKAVGGKLYSAASNKVIQKIDQLLAEQPDNARLRREGPLLQDEAARENVAQDPGVAAAFRRIEERICQNALGLHAAALDRCERMAAAADYLAAQNEMRGAENVVREYPSCKIAPERLNSLRDRVNACARYQQTLADASDKIRLFDHARAIAYFEEAAKLYADPLVSANLKEHPSGKLYTYLLGEKNGTLQLAGANRFAERESFEESYQLLKQALYNRADARQTVLLQNKLGRAFAEKNFSRTVKAKDALASICPPEFKKTLKAFQKAFSARWKELERLP